MLEDVLLSVLGQKQQIQGLVKKELNRLLEKGYVQGDPEELAAEVLGQLEERASQAKDATLPLLKGVGDSLRAALDIPSRSEILALTKALEQHRAEASRDDAGA